MNDFQWKTTKKGHVFIVRIYHETTMEGQNKTKSVNVSAIVYRFLISFRILYQNRFLKFLLVQFSIKSNIGMYVELNVTNIENANKLNIFFMSN